MKYKDFVHEVLTSVSHFPEYRNGMGDLNADEIDVVIGHMDLVGTLPVNDVRIAGGTDSSTNEKFNEVVIDVGTPEDLLNNCNGLLARLSNIQNTLKILDNAAYHDRIQDALKDAEYIMAGIFQLSILAGMDSERDDEEG